MKTTYVLLSTIVFVTVMSGFQTNRLTKASVVNKNTEELFSAGGQHSLTGAPGENNCTLCHTGTVLDGVSENNFVLVDSEFNSVNSYIPGMTYTATLQLNSSPAKKGFSGTVLDNQGNLMAGSLTGAGIGGTQDFENNDASRQYVSNTATSNTDAVSLWSWAWEAPLTDVGNVTFYIASSVTNDNGSASGDQIYLSEHVIVFNSGVGIDETLINTTDFTAGYSSLENKVILNFNSLVADEMFFNLIDLKGRSIFSRKMNISEIGSNKQRISLPSDIKNGMYVVNFFIGNKAMSAKILVTQ